MAWPGWLGMAAPGGASALTVGMEAHRRGSCLIGVGALLIGVGAVLIGVERVLSAWAAFYRRGPLIGVGCSYRRGRVLSAWVHILSAWAALSAWVSDLHDLCQARSGQAPQDKCSPTRHSEHGRPSS